MCIFNTRPLYASAAKNNAASIRVLEKCGFAIRGSAKALAKARGNGIEEVFFELVRKGGIPASSWPCARTKKINPSRPLSHLANQLLSGKGYFGSDGAVKNHYAPPTLFPEVCPKHCLSRAIGIAPAPSFTASLNWITNTSRGLVTVVSSRRAHVPFSRRRSRLRLPSPARAPMVHIVLHRSCRDG